MELRDEFDVDLDPDEAWRVLTDLERVAPCMPGAELQEVDGDEYRGVVKVRVGPITAAYRGVATFVERDDVGRRAVVRAEGRDTRGQGSANATVTASLSPAAAGTRVSVATDLQVTGKVAQFGRGVMADVSTKLMAQFVENLERTVLGAPAEPDGAAGFARDGRRASPVGAGPSGPARRLGTRPTEPVDLLGMAGAPIARRAVPLVAGALIALATVVVVRRLRRRGR